MLPTLPVDMTLTAEDHADLEEFLEDAGGMAWAAGYFAALSTGPDLVVPSTWLPPLLGDEPFEDQGDAAATIALLLAYQGEIRRKVDAGDTTFCPESDDAEALGEFCEGFLEGARLQTSWGKDDEATLRLFTFAALAGEIRDEDLRGTAEKPADPEAWRETERTRVGQRVLEIRDHWDAKKKAAREPVRVGPKVGRNDPCPCGSGKKHKKCCLA